MNYPTRADMVNFCKRKLLVSHISLCLVVGVICMIASKLLWELLLTASVSTLVFHIPWFRTRTKNASTRLWKFLKEQPKKVSKERVGVYIFVTTLLVLIILWFPMHVERSEGLTFPPFLKALGGLIIAGIIVLMSILGIYKKDGWWALLLSIPLVGTGAVMFPGFWESISHHWAFSTASVLSFIGLTGAFKHPSWGAKTAGLVLAGTCVFCGHQATEPVSLEDQLSKVTKVVNLAIPEPATAVPEPPPEPIISSDIITQYTLVIEKDEEKEVLIDSFCRVSLKYVTPTEVRVTKLSGIQTYRFTSQIPSKLNFGNDLVSLTFIGIGEGSNKSSIGVRIKPNHH